MLNIKDVKLKKWDPSPYQFLLLICTFSRLRTTPSNLDIKWKVVYKFCTIFIFYLLILGKDVVNPMNYCAKIDIFHKAPRFDLHHNTSVVL